MIQIDRIWVRIHHGVVIAFLIRVINDTEIVRSPLASLATAGKDKRDGMTQTNQAVFARRRV
jgi:hypothetical protein